MNTAKSYKNSEGKDRTIHQMVREEPEWAANRIQAGEEAIAGIAAANKRALDMAALIRRLANSLKRVEPHNTLPAQAMRYLQDNGHASAILRDADLPDQDISDTLKELEAETVKAVTLENKLIAANKRAEDAESEVSLFMNMIKTVIAIPNMTDIELTQLKHNCNEVMKGKGNG